MELLVYNWHNNWLLILTRGSDYSGESYRVGRAWSPRKNTKDTTKERKGRKQVHQQGVARYEGEKLMKGRVPETKREECFNELTLNRIK